MAHTTLDDLTFVAMIQNGAKAISKNCKKINDLNVFPVPDGDTGSNMTQTFNTGAENLDKDAAGNLGETAEKLAKKLLLGARGNSGVILSQIFKGIQKGLAGKKAVNALELAEAYKAGVETSYKAVVNPVEGTILTVFRVATEYAYGKMTEASTIEDFYQAHVEGCREILPKTTDMLPALKEAGVIDSGGAGYLCIAEGMYKALLGEEETFEPDAETPAAAPKVDISAFTRDSILQFGYCTECLLRLQTSKVDVDHFDINLILDFLEKEGGESVVAYKEDDIVKIHVHTKNPGNVLTELRKYGEFLTVKIENMALQHEEILKTKAPEKKKVAIVAVANGQGLKSLFLQAGADEIVDGGQTGNPSAGDFINAFSKINAEHIIVLPNNKNIILTASQAGDLYTRAKVHVISTKTLQEGYSALAVMTPSDDIDATIEDLKNAADGVTSGEVALAVRNANLKDVVVSKGEYLALLNGDVVASSPDKETALKEILKAIPDMDDKELMTVFYGKDIDEETADELKAQLEDEYPDFEITFCNGGQDIYSYLLSVE